MAKAEKNIAKKNKSNLFLLAPMYIYLPFCL